MIGQIDAKSRAWLWIVACLAATTAGDLAGQEQAAVNVPLVGKDGGSGLTAVMGLGVEVSAEVSAGSQSDSSVTRLMFDNLLPERRLAALEGAPMGEIQGARVLSFGYRLQMRQGNPPRIVALFFESDGGAWYRVKDIGHADHGKIRLPLGTTFRRAAFATDEDDAIHWEQVKRVWLGLIVDGPASGAFEVRETRFTDKPFHPTSAVSIGTSWDVAQDPAVKSKLDPRAPSPVGVWMLEYQFEVPGGRHMYAMARTPVDLAELDAYSALQFSYWAELPTGIDNLLVMLIEADGTQYQAVPAPPGNRGWHTVTIPFDRFERGSWSKDENEQLDLEEVRHVAIGMHGTAATASSGTIHVLEAKIVP